MKYVGLGAATLATFLGLWWLIAGNEFFIYKVFAPRMESVRREVFEETKSYRQGMIQDLQNMQREYILATPEQQKALGYIILHRYADMEDSLPADLRAFVAKIRNARPEK